MMDARRPSAYEGFVEGVNKFADMVIPDVVMDGVNKVGDGFNKVADIVVPDAVMDSLDKIADTVGAEKAQDSSIAERAILDNNPYEPKSRPSGFVEGVNKFADMVIPDALMVGLAKVGDGFNKFADMVVPDAVMDGLDKIADKVGAEKSQKNVDPNSAERSAMVCSPYGPNSASSSSVGYQQIGYQPVQLPPAQPAKSEPAAVSAEPAAGSQTKSQGPSTSEPKPVPVVDLLSLDAVQEDLLSGAKPTSSDASPLLS